MKSRAELLLMQIAVAVVGIALWYLLSTYPVFGYIVLPPFFFSNPVDVAAQIVDWFTTGVIWKHLWVTLEESLLAFVIGSIGGVLIGFWFARQPRVAAVFAQASSAFFLKGSNALGWGMQNRLARIFNPKSARTVMLAVDHGYFQGPTTGLERVDLTILPLLPYADTLMLTRGILRTIIPPTFGKGIVLRASGGPSILSDLSNEQIAMHIHEQKESLRTSTKEGHEPARFHLLGANLLPPGSCR